MKSNSTFFNTLLTLSMGFAAMQQTNGQSWTLMDATFTQSLDDLEFYDENTGIVSRGYAMNQTADGAVTWGSDINFNWTVESLKYVGNASTLILGTGNGTIFKSIDGGDTWSQIGGYILSDIRAIAFNGQNGVAVDNYCKIAWSANSGDSWTAIPNNELCGNLSTLDHVDMPSSTVAYAGGNNGYMFKSSDGGQNWTTITSLPGTFDDMSGLSFATPDIGYITGVNSGSNNGMVLKTTDGGANWTDISAGLGQSISDIYAVSPSTVFVGSGGDKIYKSTDGGANWTVDFTHPTCSQCHIDEFDMGGTTLYAMLGSGGDHKKVVKLANASVGIAEVDKQRTFSVYPNPTDGQVTIALDLIPERLEVYDAVGKLVYVDSGLSEIILHIDLSELPIGIYTLKIIDTQGAATKRLLID
jgi:photosystem II stability/assembly factor-like uncharacterized protein